MPHGAATPGALAQPVQVVTQLQPIYEDEIFVWNPVQGPGSITIGAI